MEVMRQPDFKRCAAEAEKLLKKHGYSRPPIDPEKIAEGEGLRVVYGAFEAPDDASVSGFFDLATNRIIVNNEISENRITYTIAHELAHFILHGEYIRSQNYMPMPRNNYYFGEKPIEEIEADQFAANLLVPLRMLKKYQDFASARELANLFFVSEDVIRYRLDLLARHPNLAA